MSYLGLTTVVEPLNVVWMGLSMCHQANLCHKISTHQIATAFSIDDGANVAIFDDEENLE
jgi:mevalonate pyrophosphate decarboxylase